MGARIHIDGSRATVDGVTRINRRAGDRLDLRASASLVLAAWLPKVKQLSIASIHIDRGYEKIEAKLRAVRGRY
jgi:UDP-N-acetylglucosamine 1-carboxyvinyltransferase